MIDKNSAILIKLNPVTKKGKILENKFNLEDLIAKLTDQAKNYIKKDDYYRQIDVGCQVSDPKYCAKGIAFSIQKDSTEYDKHMLRVSMLHPSMEIESSKPLVYGNKDTILKYLKDENTIKQIEEKLKKLSDELENKDG